MKTSKKERSNAAPPPRVAHVNERSTYNNIKPATMTPSIRERYENFRINFAWIASNQAGQTILHRLDTALMTGNAVNALSVVRSAGTYAGNAGNGKLIDQCAGIANILNELIDQWNTSPQYSRYMDGIDPDNYPFEVVYLIHFDQAIGGRAWHYMGWTSDLRSRIERHDSGNGSALMAEVGRLSINWLVVRLWSGDRNLERRLKNRKKHATLCPLCNPDTWHTNAR